jgi:hypothetical protein
MESVNVNVTLPASKFDLLGTASLTGKVIILFFNNSVLKFLPVLPTTGKNNISHVQVTVNNPFTADLHITHIKSSVSSFGIPLGTIDTATDLLVPGNSSATSPVLNLDMNFDPAALFTLTRDLAVEAGLNVAPLDAIVSLGGYQYISPSNGTTSKRQNNIFK